jgi:hypothetical protein
MIPEAWVYIASKFVHWDSLGDVLSEPRRHGGYTPRDTLKHIHVSLWRKHPVCEGPWAYTPHIPAQFSEFLLIETPIV